MTTPVECPFCSPAQGRIAFEDRLTRGLWEAFPVTRGHLLVVPRRHVPTWFDATVEERAALVAGVDRGRELIERRHAPDGFNIGVNVGQAAGQTVLQLHVHLIPRYRGDVPDPRGGVRHVIPAKGNYLAPPTDAGRVEEARPPVLTEWAESPSHHAAPGSALPAPRPSPASAQRLPLAPLGRVYFDIEEAREAIVTVRAVGVKLRERVLIGGVEVDLA